MKSLIKILLFIWQLPQNLIGFVISRNYKCVSEIENHKIYFKEKFFGSGVSLGQFIVMDYIHYEQNTLGKKHEIGHCKQSRILGIFYLLLIGIPSITGNIYDRLAHKRWTKEKRIKWYYSQPWEKSADKLGKVKRFN